MASRCWHDTHPFDGHIYSIPIGKNENLKTIYKGAFCGLSCCKAYILDNYPDNPKILNQFYQMCSDEYNTLYVRASPPKCILQDYQVQSSTMKIVVVSPETKQPITTICQQGIGIEEYRKSLSHGPQALVPSKEGGFQFVQECTKKKKNVFRQVQFPVVDKQYVQEIFTATQLPFATDTVEENVSQPSSLTEEPPQSKNRKRNTSKKKNSNAAKRIKKAKSTQNVVCV